MSFADKKLAPRERTMRDQHSLARRRTTGQVRSIEDRFIIDPEAQTLDIYDTSGILRLRIGNLGSTYGIQWNDDAGDSLLDYSSTGGFSADPVILFSQPIKVSEIWQVENGQMRFYGDATTKATVRLWGGAIGSTNSLRLYCDGVDALLELDGDHPSVTGTFVIQAADDLRLNATNLGFGVTPVSFPITVTGSKGGNAALASLLTALANLGLVVDSTT